MDFGVSKWFETSNKTALFEFNGKYWPTPRQTPQVFDCLKTNKTMTSQFWMTMADWTIHTGIGIKENTWKPLKLINCKEL